MSLLRFLLGSLLGPVPGLGLKGRGHWQLVCAHPVRIISTRQSDACDGWCRVRSRSLTRWILGLVVVANDAVIFPRSGAEEAAGWAVEVARDAEMVIRSVFRGPEVVFRNPMAVIWGGGGTHCLTHDRG